MALGNDCLYTYGNHPLQKGTHLAMTLTRQLHKHTQEDEASIQKAYNQFLILASNLQADNPGKMSDGHLISAMTRLSRDLLRQYQDTGDLQERLHKMIGFELREGANVQ